MPSLLAAVAREPREFVVAPEVLAVKSGCFPVSPEENQTTHHFLLEFSPSTTVEPTTPRVL